MLICFSHSLKWTKRKQEKSLKKTGLPCRYPIKLEDNSVTLKLHSNPISYISGVDHASCSTVESALQVLTCHNLKHGIFF